MASFSQRPGAFNCRAHCSEVYFKKMFILNLSLNKAGATSEVKPSVLFFGITLEHCTRKVMNKYLPTNRFTNPIYTS